MLTASRENWIFANVKTKVQISFAITAKLISAFVFTTWIVKFLFLINPKFQASIHLLMLHRPVCVGYGLKLEDRFCFVTFHIIFVRYYR